MPILLPLNGEESVGSGDNVFESGMRWARPEPLPDGPFDADGSQTNYWFGRLRDK